MHVLVGRDRHESAGFHVLGEIVQGGQHPGQLEVAEQAGRVQYPGVGLRPRDVIRRQHPVEMGADAQGGHFRGRP